MNWKGLLVTIIHLIPGGARVLNRYATNKLCKAIEARPRAFSTWSHLPQPEANLIAYPMYWEQGQINDYTSWPMLTNMEYSARHLPPASDKFVDDLPKDLPYMPDPTSPQIGEVTQLFMRPESGMKKSRSTLLFMFFAQWFTDSILRVASKDRRKNTSNHNIDLCQIYGLTEETCSLLRDKASRKGKLKSQTIKGEEFPVYLGELNANGSWQVKEEFQSLPYATDDKLDALFGTLTNDRKKHLYATGLERGNSSVGYVAISTLFLREHNRICDELMKAHKDWDDERLFQTARMINIVLLMKFVVQDYIGHISDTKVFKFDHRFAEKQDWYRKPWIALEFDLLYRWHGMIPDNITFRGESYGDKGFRFNNQILEDMGLGQVLSDSSNQAAGNISLKNVPTFMVAAEFAMVRMGRDFKLQSFNAYRNRFLKKKLSSFEELTGDEVLASELESLYKHIDNLELTVGLFAEQPKDGALFGKLMNRMVAYDAFTQIYTNPLLSKNVYHANTFSEYGIQLISSTDSIVELASRNTKGKAKVSFAAQ